MKEKKAIRRYRRFYGYDYSRGAALFITIVTNPRRRLFGKIVGAKLQKTPLGLAVERRFAEMAQMPGIRLFKFVVMQDHVHFQLHLRAGLANPLVTLGRAIGAFKSLCAKDFHELTGESGSLWQQGYHDWLCLSRPFIESVERYIAYNPLKYELFNNQPGMFHIVEPLIASRLDPADYWKGIGNISLLSPDVPIASLRVSRSIQDFRGVLSQVAKLVEDGYAILSGFISPGEIAVRDMLIGDPRAKIIHILTNSMPYFYKPDSRYLLPLQEGRFLEIAHGNAPEEFTRRTCLDLNQEIIEIAQAGIGKEVYLA